jgi:1-acyl-sn-glycerol-3-phosphate acyltransferase
VKMLGWRFVGELPGDPKLIIIGAPHTSNWDFFLFLAAISHWGIQPRYLAKHTLFEGAFGGLFRRWGGIPVDRSKPGGVVGQVKAEFDATDRLILAMAPEGTRTAAPFWKSGFLAIAEATGAALVPAKISGSDRTVMLGPSVPTSPIESTMGELREFFSDAKGVRPEGAGPVRVVEEGRPRS